jgi:hypothetical protein
VSATTTLTGGPFDGRTIPIKDYRDSLILEGDPVPEGMVARYRPTRKRGTHRFRGYELIVARIPVGSDHDSERTAA